MPKIKTKNKNKIKEKQSKSVTRKNFLKGGIIAAGSTIGAGFAVTGTKGFFPGTEAAPFPEQTYQNIYKCPIDGKDFETFADLKKHFKEAHPEAELPVMVKLNVNGKDYDVQIEPHWTLQHALQYRLGLTGAKTKCYRGVCGSCTVIMDGRAVLSCITLAIECEGKSIETVEGIAENPQWEPLIESYCKWEAMQCGYCTPGFVVTAKHLLDKNPKPTEDEIKQALAGNVCSCGTYSQHPIAILEAAEEIKG
jgi:aerobic-type carbon monoxide dehydrogenase small subunit (CoxS/CutS family)